MKWPWSKKEVGTEFIKEEAQPTEWVQINETVYLDMYEVKVHRKSTDVEIVFYIQDEIKDMQQMCNPGQFDTRYHDCRYLSKALDRMDFNIDHNNFVVFKDCAVGKNVFDRFMVRSEDVSNISIELYEPNVGVGETVTWMTREKAV